MTIFLGGRGRGREREIFAERDIFYHPTYWGSSEGGEGEGG